MQITHFAHRTEVLEDPTARHSELSDEQGKHLVFISACQELTVVPREVFWLENAAVSKLISTALPEIRNGNISSHIHLVAFV